MGYAPEVAIALEQERLGAKIAAEGGGGLRGAVGTPEQLRQYLRRYEAAGVDQIIFVIQAGNNKHEHIMESLELFAREVMPEFKARDEEQRAKKRKRLEPVIEAAMKRRVDNAPALPEGYTITPMIRKMIEQQVGKEAIEKFQHEQATGAGPSVMHMAARARPQELKKRRARPYFLLVTSCSSLLARRLALDEQLAQRANRLARALLVLVADQARRQRQRRIEQDLKRDQRATFDRRDFPNRLEVIDVALGHRAFDDARRALAWPGCSLTSAQKLAVPCMTLTLT